jgi:hypothetical protein
LANHFIAVPEVKFMFLSPLNIQELRYIFEEQRANELWFLTGRQITPQK